MKQRKGESEEQWRERTRKYQREYYQKHKKRLNTWHREYYKKNREQILAQQKEYLRQPKIKERRKMYQRKIRKFVKDFLIQKLGEICIVCNTMPKSNYLVFHDKTLKPHEHLTPNQIKQRWQDFVPMCRNCHRTLHHFIKYKDKFEKINK